VECARSWLVRMGSGRLSFLVLSDEYGSYWKLHLVLQIVAVRRLFLHVNYRWWPVVGGASRHSWQQRSINVIIKGCRIKRCREEYVNAGVYGLSSLKGVRLSSKALYEYLKDGLCWSIP